MEALSSITAALDSGTLSQKSSSSNSSSSKSITTTTCTFAEVYTTDQKLRSGSYGTVYTCRNKLHPDRTYAVKIMDRSQLKASALESVQKEVEIVHALTRQVQSRSSTDSSSDNPKRPHHVVELIDFFVEPRQLYMVQEYAAGGDVFDRLTSRRQYTEGDARALALELLETVNFLHSNRPYPIVHRDLKPENLLLLDLVSDTSILVADFGFARFLKDDEKCHTRCGTPAYVSPEILLGLPYDQSTDLWSIGCLLYMLVSGYAPFQAPHHRALFRKIRAGDFVFHEQYWKNVSLPAKQLISHLLTVNPNNRWTAEVALKCDWFKKSKLAQLQQHDLSGNLEEMKKFRPGEAWKRAFNALGFCSTAPFWKSDVCSFSRQMIEWDKSATTAGSGNSSLGILKEDGAAATSTTTPTTSAASNSTMLLNKWQKLKFADRYELKKQLRKGSYAVVWECVHKQKPDTVFAAKVIQRKGLKPKDDEAVLNEVAVMQSLAGNKYVVQLLDFYEEEDYFYLVMEYCAGGDVFDRVVQFKHYTESDARDLAIMLLKAVQSLHRANIAHRDIKPQNLLLLSDTDHSTIKLADFGFARRVHTPESLTSRVGTPTYVAPEILKNLPHDQRVDLWSVGVVIFVLLVGYPPFLDDKQSELFRKIRGGEWVFYEEDWKHISQDAKNLIEGLLVADPADRWSIEKCLRSKWINQDESELEAVDLQESVQSMRKKKSVLRSMARAFMGLGDKTKPVDVATQAQAPITDLFKPPSAESSPTSPRGSKSSLGSK